MSDVFLDDFSRDFVTDRSDKIAIFPELTTPELLFDLWLLFENGTSTQTLKTCDDLRDREIERRGAKEQKICT